MKTLNLRLSIPADGPLGTLLTADIATRQKAEDKLAKIVKRDRRHVTPQEAILSLLSDHFGVPLVMPKPGRRTSTRQRFIVACSSCGEEYRHYRRTGFSHCSDHAGMKPLK